MDICGRQSKLLPEMKYLRLIWRVVRRLVWETATDNTTGLAAQMAYLLLFALAPGSLFLWHLLGSFWHRSEQVASDVSSFEKLHAARSRKCRTFWTLPWPVWW